MKRITFTTDETKVGMHWFETDGEFKEGVPCHGIGEEKYGEGSVFVGEMTYNGSCFFKDGKGEQTFYDSVIRFNLAVNGLQMVRIIGVFDRFNWINSNCVLLYDDENGKPSAWSKGHYIGVQKNKEWQGDFSLSLVPEQYASLPELTIPPKKLLIEEYHEKYADVTHTKNLFLGDSWVELWYTTPCGDGNVFEKQCKDAKISGINIGVGGTRYENWMSEIGFIAKLHPENIFVNLGFNDLHTDSTAESAFNTFNLFIDGIREKLPDVKFFVTAVSHLPKHKDTHDGERALNKLIEEYSFKNEFVKYLPVNGVYAENGITQENFNDFATPDGSHLNKKGYEIWGNYVLNEMKKEEENG
ncbi:MAG: GDSL-type esterase/lipase family protein [Clostridia bacterium]|nr:GDSL-type esterase/lipase family protein [Clostridia bacterium]